MRPRGSRVKPFREFKLKRPISLVFSQSFSSHCWNFSLVCCGVLSQAVYLFAPVKPIRTPKALFPWPEALNPHLEQKQGHPEKSQATAPLTVSSVAILRRWWMEVVGLLVSGSRIFVTHRHDSYHPTLSRWTRSLRRLQNNAAQAPLVGRP